MALICTRSGLAVGVVFFLEGFLDTGEEFVRRIQSETEGASLYRDRRGGTPPQHNSIYRIPKVRPIGPNAVSDDSTS